MSYAFHPGAIHRCEELASNRCEDAARAKDEAGRQEKREIERARDLGRIKSARRALDSALPVNALLQRPKPLASVPATEGIFISRMGGNHVQ